MRITFLLPFVHLTGGIKAALEFGNQLQQMGHEVLFVYPQRSPYPQEFVQRDRTLRTRVGQLFQGLKYQRDRLLGRKITVDWFDLKANLQRVPDLNPRHIPDGDIVVAVDWTTAEHVVTYPVAKGCKFYLIQGYDIWSGPRERIDATWQAPLHKIVISSWLKSIAEQRFQTLVFGPVVYGVDHTLFNNPDPESHTPPRVGMLYHSLPIKGVQDGLRAVALARQYQPLQLVMYGSGRPTVALPDGTEFHLRPVGEALRDLYRSCDIWLCPSRMDGGPIHPLEAMACRCALVTTDVGAIRDYTIPGETALVSPPGDWRSLADNLIRLLLDQELRLHIAEAGYRYTQHFTWERAAKEMERLFIQQADSQTLDLASVAKPEVENVA